MVQCCSGWFTLLHHAAYATATCVVQMYLVEDTENLNTRQESPLVTCAY